MAVLPAVLGNLAIGLAGSLISSWLTPKSQNKVPDDLPVLTKGAPFYYVWGECVCPMVLLCGLTPAQANTDDKHSSYTTIGLANPENTQLLALRINGYIISTKSNNYFLTPPDSLGLSSAGKGKGKSKKKGGDPLLQGGTYVNAYGLTTYNDVVYFTQFGTPSVYNSQFAALGYSELRYQGLGWLAITGRRNLIGLPAARQAIYINNCNPTITSYTANGSNNDPIVCSVSINYSNSLVFTNTVDLSFSSLHGFRGSQKVICFEGSSPGSQSYSELLIANGTEYIIKADLTAGATVTISITNSGQRITAANPITTLGNYATRILDSSLISTPVVTNLIVVGSEKGELAKLTLTNSYTSPFRSNNGNIYDSTNTLVGTMAPTLRIYGWNEYIYTNIISNPFSPNNTAAVTFNRSSIKLSRIITDLLKVRQFDTSKIIFKSGFDEDIVGFTATSENVKESILNLLTCHNKIIARDRSDNIIFAPYPSVNSRVMTIDASMLTAEPSIELLHQAALPECIEFTYRNRQMELSEDTLLVGNSAGGTYKTSIRLNENLSSTEAYALGWNALNLLKNTNLKATIQLDFRGQILEPLDIVDFNFLPSQTLTLLITDIEYGQDLSVKLTCVNFVGAQPAYLNRDPTVNILPPVSPPATPDSYAYLNTEPTAINETLARGGSLLYTTNTAPYSATGGIPAVTTTLATTVGSYQGVVSGIFTDYVNPLLGIVGITIDNSRSGQVIPTPGTIRLGASWVSYTSVTSRGTYGYTILGVKVGLYGSTSKIAVGDLAYASGYNLIYPNSPTVFPSVAQGGYTALAPTYNLGLANATYGLPVVSFTVTSGVLRAYFGSSGSRSTLPFLAQTGGVPDFDRYLYIQCPATSTAYSMLLPAGQRYLELALSTTPITYVNGNTITIVESSSAAGLTVPSYGSNINSAIVV